MAAIGAAFLAGTASPAVAHEGVQLTIHSDGTGTVWVTAAWADGHPVTEQTTALFNATSTTGEKAGPTGMRRPKGVERGMLQYPDQLRAGEWTVVVEMSSPALARCQAVVKVAAAGEAPVVTEVPCAVASSSPSDAAAPRSVPAIWYVGITALLVGVTVAAGLYAWMGARQRQRSRARRRPPARPGW
jgi:hypothetical protein